MYPCVFVNSLLTVVCKICFCITQFRCSSDVSLAAVEGVDYLDVQFQGFTAVCQYYDLFDCTVLEMPRWLQAIISASHMVPVRNTGNSSNAGWCQHVY